jgi:hypothetical protein
MLNELAKRKPNFDETNSVRVVLADGQSWALPKPWLELRPGFKDGKSVAAYPVFTYGPVIEALVAVISEADGFLEQISALATLGARLLQFHYELTDADLDQLLAYRRNDPASVGWSAAVMETATGRNGPKVGCAGGD